MERTRIIKFLYASVVVISIVLFLATHTQIRLEPDSLGYLEISQSMLEGHYWTDRNTAGELRLTKRQKNKFQDFKSAQAHYAKL